MQRVFPKLRRPGGLALLALLLLSSAVLWGPRAAQAQVLESTFTTTPPDIDGVVDFGEWNFEEQVAFEHGFVTAVNDRDRLYLLVDVLDDGIEDARSDGAPGDHAELIFDVDENGAVTGMVDAIYTLLPGSYDLRVQRYLTSGIPSRLPPHSEPSHSSLAAGFGCFAADGSQPLTLFPPGADCANHRVFEYAIDLDEIGGDAGPLVDPPDRVHLHLQVASESPAFIDEVPGGLPDDLGETIQVVLTPSPLPIDFIDPTAVIAFASEDSDDDGDGFVDDPLEVTQAVQSRENDLPLVRGKDTVARVYVEGTGDLGFRARVRVHLHGERAGHDLPGSPLLTRSYAPQPVTSTTDHSPTRTLREGRDNLRDSANFALPESWTRGIVRLRADATFLDTEVESRTVSVAYSTRRTPTIWVVPVNQGTESAPVLPTDAAIAASQSYLETIFPVPDVEFVRQDWRVLGEAFDDAVIDGEDLVRSIKPRVVRYWDGLVAAGAELPDLLYAFTPNATTAQGYAVDPVWCLDAACGHFAIGNVRREISGVEFEFPWVMAHEFDHVLDREDEGTWDEHVGSCSGEENDPEWSARWEDEQAGRSSRYTLGTLRQYGFDTRTPWYHGYERLSLPFDMRTFTVIPPYFPDLMSNCRAASQEDFMSPLVNALPMKWVSPYRWEKLFEHFEPEGGLPTLRRMSLYVAGRIGLDGSGLLHRAFVLPGAPIEPSDTQSDYRVEVQDRRGRVLFEVPFVPRFSDFPGVDDHEEAVQVDTYEFSFQLPSDRRARRIVLKRGGQILDVIERSKHRPRVRVLSPQARDEWDGRAIIRWKAWDRDGDPLEASIFYKPHPKASWQPIAWGVEGEEYELDTSRLPGGKRARLAVAVTDGWNTTRARSWGRFHVAMKPPRAFITRPEPGLRLPSDEVVLLEADATDLEDERIPDSDFLWFLGDPQQQVEGIGTGRRLPLRLPDGLHRVTLVVVDGQGQVGEDTRTLAIGEEHPQ